MMYYLCNFRAANNYKSSKMIFVIITSLIAPHLDEDGDDEHIPPDKNEVMAQLRILSAKLADLSTCNDLITKQVCFVNINLEIL